MREFLQFIGELVLPCSCEICGVKTHKGYYICSECMASFERPQAPLCFKCGEPMLGGFSDESQCRQCKDNAFVFDFARAMYINTGHAREMLLKFKYAHGAFLTKSLCKGMAELQETYREIKEISLPLIVPVPMHDKKVRKRGYNQAVELANALSKAWNLPLCHALGRIHDQRAQATLTRRQRKAHVKNIYYLTKQEEQNQTIQGRNILLIDDVFTTGNTANACAKLLLKAGASRIIVLTLLRSHHK